MASTKTATKTVAPKSKAPAKSRAVRSKAAPAPKVAKAPAKTPAKAKGPAKSKGKTAPVPVPEDVADSGSEHDDGSRKYTIVFATCNDVEYDESVFSTKSAVFKGKYPFIAAKKAVGGLRTKFDITSDSCDIRIAIREQTQGSDKKITFYTGSVSPRDEPVVVTKQVRKVVDGQEVVNERKIVYRMMTKCNRVNTKSDLYTEMDQLLQRLAPNAYQTYVIRPAERKKNRGKKNKRSSNSASDGDASTDVSEAVSEPVSQPAEPEPVSEPAAAPKKKRASKPRDSGRAKAKPSGKPKAAGKGRGRKAAAVSDDNAEAVEVSN